MTQNDVRYMFFVVGAVLVLTVVGVLVFIRSI